MSAASTQTYYRELCDLTQQRRGGLHSPQLLIRSLDFAEIEALQMSDDWGQAGNILNREARAMPMRSAVLPSSEPSVATRIVSIILGLVALSSLKLR